MLKFICDYCGEEIELGTQFIKRTVVDARYTIRNDRNGLVEVDDYSSMGPQYKLVFYYHAACLIKVDTE